MGQRDRDFIEKMDQHMEELNRLHQETLRAADRVQDGADRTEMAVEKIEIWTLALQKRIEKIELHQAFIMGGAMVAGAALWDKAKKVLGINA